MSAVAELWHLDIRHLAALDAIARTRSISRAAEDLGYGQSAVSQQLAALERVVGQRLVDRGTGPRPVTLTAAGESLLGHARWILERLGAARNDLERLDSGSAGSLQVGTFQSAGARLLPSVLAAFRKAWPAISISIHTETQGGELAEMLLNGSLDVAFVESSNLGPGLEHRELIRDRYVGLVPPGHRLATKRVVKLADFDGEDLIDGVLKDECTERTNQALRSAGAETRVVFRTDDNPTRQRLVDAGLGCAVLPGLTVEPGLTNGAVILTLKEDIHRDICLAWASDRTPGFALGQFVEIAQSTLSVDPLHKRKI